MRSERTNRDRSLFKRATDGQTCAAPTEDLKKEGKFVLGSRPPPLPLSLSLAPLAQSIFSDCFYERNCRGEGGNKYPTFTEYHFLVFHPETTSFLV